MKITIILFALGWLLWFVLMYRQIKNAPEGYERDDKFHYGKEPIKNQNNKHE